MRPSSFASFTLAGALALAGCSATADNETTNPNNVDQGATQVSAAMALPYQAVTAAAMTELAEEGKTTGGTARRGTGPAALPLLGSFVPVQTGIPAPAATEFSYQGHVDISVDLDTQTGSGDKYPNVSGVIRVVADGTSQATGAASGTVSYQVSVTVTTDVTATDPESGATCTWPVGTTTTQTLTIDWTKTGLDSWALSVSGSGTTPAHDVTVVRNGTTYNGHVNSMSHQASLTWQSGQVPQYTLTGQRDVTWTSGTSTWHVVWDVQSTSIIYITINDKVYGPFTAAQVKAWFKSSV